MTELAEKVGFGATITETKFFKKRRDGVELLATLALAVALVIAATAVSLGVARAAALHGLGAKMRAPLALIVAIRP
jgi:hypothetical protein